MKPHAVESALQERPLGKSVLRTYRATVDIDDVLPNANQPRMGSKTDPELQRQIEANEGVFEPLLLEPDPDRKGKFRIIDGERRWTNAKILVEEQKKLQYRSIPAEITDRTLSEEDRLRTWIYIHRQRREWDAREKEMVAYRLVELLGRASAANILGINSRELEKLVDTYELSQRLTHLREPGASITWAREIRNLNRSLLSPDVISTIVRKVNDKEMTNSKDVRKLRGILRDPVARAEFMADRGTIERALLRVPAPEGHVGDGLVGELDRLAEAIRRHPWSTLIPLKGNDQVLQKIGEAERLLSELKAVLDTASSTPVRSRRRKK